MKASTKPNQRAEMTAAPRRSVRRKVAAYIVVSALAIVVSYGAFVEPHWLAVKTVPLASQPRLRVVHFSDLHYQGDRGYLQRVVQLANAQQPDFTCITGDFVSKARHLPEALEILADLSGPVYAVTGNWDYWSHADLTQIADFCERSGGKLLSDETIVVPEYNLAISGAEGHGTDWIKKRAAEKHILLVHYPRFVETLLEQHLSFDLILAGHSHGGQVRVPLIGSIVVPYGVGRYDLGLFETAAGPLYVTSGVGTSAFPIRLNCRPEIAVIEF